MSSASDGLQLILEDAIGTRLEEIPLGPRRVTLGRGLDCGIRLPSPFISERHATIQPFRVDGQGVDGWTLTPSGLNGTRVNQRLVLEGTCQRLQAGDIIEIPGFMLRVIDPQRRRQGSQYRLEMNRRYSEVTAALHERLLEQVDLRRLTSEEVPEETRRQSIRDVLGRLLDQSTDLEADLEEFILRESLRSALVDRLLQPEAASELWLADAHERAFGELVEATARSLGVPEPGTPLRDRVRAVNEGFGKAQESLEGRIASGLRRHIVRRALLRDLENLVFHLGPIEDLLRLPDLNEIMVIGNRHIFIEKQGELQETGCSFPRHDDLEVVIGRIVNPVGRFVNRSQPIVDARLADGSRVHIVIPPVSLRGPAITIRKFRKDPFTFEELIERETLGWHAARFLRGAVAARKNLIISGGTSSGKTTLLNCLGAQISSQERLVVIEDAAELQLPQPNQVVLEAKRANVEGEGAVTIRDLVRAALRMRPDRIIVGECRGREALDMLQAMNTGHDGSLTTAHANSPRDLMSRLEVMVLEAGEALPIPAIHRQIAGALDLVVQIQKQSDRQRRVTYVSEVVGYDPEAGVVQIEDIFRRVEPAENQGVPGDLAFTGYLPTFIEELLDRGATRLEDLLSAAGVPGNHSGG